MANLRATKIYGTSGPDANGSALFNGTDYLTAANAAAFRLNQGSGADLTMEAWIYAKSYDSQFTIASLYVTTGNKRSYHLYVNTDGELKFNYSSNGTAGATSAINAGVIPKNEWIHVALTHDTSATTVRLFKNGVLAASDTSAMATWYANTDSDFVLGKTLDGFISNFHINKGTCKYTASFDPYKQPIEVETNTSVLCCNSSTDALNDDKSNTFVQTASDGVKPTSDMPFSRSDGGVVFDGDIKINSQGHMYFPTGDTSQRSRGLALFGGGITPSITSMMDYCHIPTMGNLIRWGDLTASKNETSAFSSSTRGVWAGGTTGTYQNVIESVEFATQATPTDFGDLTVARGHSGGTSNSTRGLVFGGYDATPNPDTMYNRIDYVTIATSGDAINFGDASETGWSAGGARSSTTRAVTGGYATPSNTNTIDYVTIATTGDASNFGDLNHAGYGTGAGNVSNGTRAVFLGNSDGPSNTIDYITIATTGDATDFGDLTAARRGGGSASTLLRGILVGGRTPSEVKTIDYVTIATTGNASDFGDATSQVSFNHAGCSDSHGGLS